MSVLDAAWRPSLVEVASLAGVRSVFPAGISPTSDPNADDVNSAISFVMREVIAALAGEEPAVEDTDYAKDAVILGVAHYLFNGILPAANVDADSGQAAFYRLRYQEHLAVLSGGPTTTGGVIIYDPIVA